eukprot:4440539-Amphidinium_carterae.1
MCCPDLAAEFSTASQIHTRLTWNCLKCRIYIEDLSNEMHCTPEDKRFLNPRTNWTACVQEPAC